VIVITLRACSDASWQVSGAASWPCH